MNRRILLDQLLTIRSLMGSKGNAENDDSRDVIRDIAKKGMTLKKEQLTALSTEFLLTVLLDVMLLRLLDEGATVSSDPQRLMDDAAAAGESKIVRNLTRPPMVNSNLEFVTCMHARKLSQQDLQTLSSNNSDPNQPTDGYIVVSRAVTGGQWNSDDSNNVRNEIILGVNILRQVPNEPDKTELIAVTHVYSPMIPLMLAKNAGVKGAVDFVRDIRSLP
mmetsp:Transcript_11227/g.16888  ORF Transcript_11227/g.16888 Transcript_11227/m.16888 type:complete len:219 (+) Transcript_11227:110-766(+)